jgi:hypothetical protein
MYIQSRPEPPSREPFRPNLRPLIPLLIAVAMFAAAPLVAPIVAYGLILGAGALVARCAAKLLPSSNGLEEHRQ